MIAVAHDVERFDERRFEELFHQQRYALCRATDRMFAALMILQWLGGIATAMIVSPRTWIGDTSTVHHHVWAAVFLGGAISSLPIIATLMYPGQVLTRHLIAVGQMLWSALLIHLSGGRIETHFHVFGSLAFLAFYRDWRVLVTATIVIAADHLVRGEWWPQSVFGVLVESRFRWIEHAAWVVFEDIILVQSCVRGIRETREICRRQAILEATNARIETTVMERTEELRLETHHKDLANQELERKARELAATNSQLTEEIAERKRLEEARTELQSRLLESSRIAGMAEVANGVLHNVGNVLNSVNVSTSCLIDRTRASDVQVLAKASQVIEQHRGDLPRFLTSDRRGQAFPQLLSELASSLTTERQQQLEELRTLAARVEHIKEIINMQQSFSCTGGCQELVSVRALLQDALKINDAGLLRHEVDVIHQIADVPPVQTDRHKVLQILVNLISNAKYALSDARQPDRRMTLVVEDDDDWVVVQVRDTGIGIPRENLTKIFAHGFTTRAAGHGFGLHSAALAAQELGGSLSAYSDGPGTGAVFTLRLPRKAEDT
jgi:C4-dicarboxylate-specific signal transduction histidine kinase